MSIRYNYFLLRLR